MRRRWPVAAASVWTALVLTWEVFFHGQVLMCLGGIEVTEASCRAALGLPPLTEWDRFASGWGVVAILLAAGWSAIAVVVRRKRQRGGL